MLNGWKGGAVAGAMSAERAQRPNAILVFGSHGFSYCIPIESMAKFIWVTNRRALGNQANIWRAVPSNA